jgi:hypothetical protein
MDLDWSVSWLPTLLRFVKVWVDYTNLGSNVNVKNVDSMVDERVVTELKGRVEGLVRDLEYVC